MKLDAPFPHPPTDGDEQPSVPEIEDRDDRQWEPQDDRWPEGEE